MKVCTHPLISFFAHKTDESVPHSVPLRFPLIVLISADLRTSGPDRTSCEVTNESQFTNSEKSKLSRKTFRLFARPVSSCQAVLSRIQGHICAGN